MTSKYEELKIEIEKKEKNLIESISNRISDNIESEISDSLKGVSQKLNAADEKAKELDDLVESLSQNVQSLKEIDFSEQLIIIKETQERLEKSSIEAKESFDAEKEINNKLIADITKSINEWKTIGNQLTNAVEEINRQNKVFMEGISSVERSVTELAEINGQLDSTLGKIQEEQLNIVDAVSEKTASTVSNIIAEKMANNTGELLKIVNENDAKLDRIIMETKKNNKRFPIAIGTAIITGIVLVLLVLSFFI